MKTSLKIAISILVFDIVFFGSSFIQNKNFVQMFANSFSQNSFLALVMGDGGIFSSALKIKNQTLTIGNGLSTPNKVSFTWTGGAKPYFVEFQTSSGWETIGENIEVKEYTHEVPASESFKRELCYRVGYVKTVREVNTTYISAPSCIQVISGMIEGDVTTLDTGLKFKTVTLYETADDSENGFKIVATYSGGKAPYAIHAQSGSKQWTPVGNTTEKTITALVPKTVTNGETNVCLMLHYQKAIKKINTQMTSVPFCMPLLSAIPDGGTGEGGGEPVKNVKASKITHYNAVLKWTKSKNSIDGYAIYRDGELAAQTKTNTFTEEPILMPDTSYIYSVFEIPKGTTPVEELPPLVSATAVAKAVATAETNSAEVETKEVPPVPTKGEVKVLAIPIYYHNEDFSDYPYVSPEILKKKIFSDSDSVANFYKEASFGKLSITGTVSDITIGVGRPLFFDTFFEVKDQKKMYININKAINVKYNISQYDIVLYNLPYMNKSIGGQMLLGVVDEVTKAGGDIKGRIWMNGNQPNHIYSHEFGHKLGLHHAGSDTCSFFSDGSLSCFDANVYGDWADVMANLSSYHPDTTRKAQLDWIKETEIKSGGNYIIVPTENSKSTYQYLFSGDKKMKFYFDYRIPSDIENNPIDIPEFKAGLYFKARIDREKNAGEKYYVTYNLVEAKLPILSVGRQIVTKDFYVWNLNEDLTGAKIFVRFLKDSIPTINSAYSYSKTFDKTFITWTAIEKAAGYELFRDDITAPAIYTGSALNYTDSEPGRHIYYVRAYDAFTELPGKTYPLEFSISKKAELEKLPTAAPADLRAVSEAGFKQTTITWSSVFVNGANGLMYELYRNSTTDTPIYTGKNLTYTDKVAGQHTYYIRAYRTFTAFPGDKYYTDMSKGVKSSVALVVAKPNPQNNPFIYPSNPCPSYNDITPVYMGNAKTLYDRAKTIPGAKMISIMTSVYNPYYQDWSVPYTKFYNITSPTGDILIHDRLPFETVDGMNKYRTRVLVVDSQYKLLEEILTVQSGHWAINQGGSCKVAEMRSSKTSCSTAKTDIYSKKDSVWKSQPNTMSASCPLDTIKITNAELLIPKLIAFEPSTEWFGTNGTYVTQSGVAQTGVAIIMPISP